MLSRPPLRTSEDPGTAKDPREGQCVVLEGDAACGQRVTVLPDVLAGLNTKFTPGPVAMTPSMQKAE